MNKERNLYRELNIAEPCGNDSIPTPDTQNIKAMVHKRIAAVPTERKVHVMKARLKYSLAAAVAILALATTALATNGIIVSWNGSSSSIPDYTTLPTAQECAEVISFEPVLMEQFENGYAFTEGNVVRNEMTGENNHVIESFNSLSFQYEKNSDQVTFSQLKCNTEIEQSGSITANVDDINIYYNGYTMKAVPVDYEMTDADKLAEASGALVFSWGSDAVEIIQVQSVGWFKDGIHYSLMQLDGALTPAELTNMAAEIIKR